MSSTIRLGGQAVVDGVMIRTPRAWAVAVRRPDGQIAVTERSVPGWATRGAGVPLVRGFLALLVTVTLGMRAMEWSRQTAGSSTRRSVDGAAKATALLAVAVVLGLVLVLPALLARWVVSGAVAVAAVEAVVRLAVLFAYVAGVSRLPGIEDVLRYHGAEHQAIAAYEAGADLEVAVVGTFSPRHPRCGTDFLVLVGALSIVVYGFLGQLPLALLVASRLLLLPLLAGVAFEILRLGGRPGARGGPVVALGLALQRLTTRPSTPAHVEVAVAALRHAVGPTVAPPATPPASHRA